MKEVLECEVANPRVAQQVEGLLSKLKGNSKS